MKTCERCGKKSLEPEEDDCNDIPECDELTLAYMSIDTMKARITTLEHENTRLREEVSKLHRDSTESCWESTEGYYQGFGRGHGY